MFFAKRSGMRIVKVNLDTYDEQLIGPAEFKVNDFAVVDQNLVLLSSDGKLCKIDFEGVERGQRASLDEAASSRGFACEEGWLRLAECCGSLAAVGYSRNAATNYLVILDKDLKYKTHTNIPCTEGNRSHPLTKQTRSSTCAPGGRRTRWPSSSCAGVTSTTLTCAYSMERKWSI